METTPSDLETLLPDVEMVPDDYDLEEVHARMRARDRERIESGDATPAEIQRENSMFSKYTTFKIVKLTA